MKFICFFFFGFLFSFGFAFLYCEFERVNLSYAIVSFASIFPSVPISLCLSIGTLQVNSGTVVH
jgi:hypothetical protein